MKRSVKKTAVVVLSCLLASTMVLSACGRRGGKNAIQKVSADDPWFNATTIELGGEYDENDYDFLYSEIVGISGDLAVVSVTGSLPLPDDFDWENGNYNDYYMDKIEIYDMEGNRISSFDWSDVLEENGFDPNDSSISARSVKDGKVLVDIYEWNMMSSDEYSALFDIETGELSDIEEMTEGDDGSISGVEDASYEGYVEIEGYGIKRYWLYDNSGNGNTSYIFDITDPDGRETRMDLREEMPGRSIFDISTFIPMGEGKVLVLCSATPDFQSILDLNGMTFTEYTEDTEWLGDIDFFSLKYVEGCGCFEAGDDAIRRIDFENKTVTEVLRYDACSVSLNRLRQLDIFSCDDDRIVMGGMIWERSYSGNVQNSEIIVLERADSNPHAGKTVLRAGFVDYISDAAAESIIDFNEGDHDYFIRYDLSYLVDDYSEEVTDYDSIDWEQWSLDAQSAMSNQLAIDLLAGDGPDIIFDACGYSQLNNDNYLVDISDLIPTGDVFDNVIDLCRTNGKLYQLPVAFIMEGISTKVTDISAGSVGFTYDEYIDFVNTVCNGTDPLQRSQIDAFILLMSCMSDRFTDDNGLPGYDNEEFRTLAEFVRDNIVYVEPDYTEDYYYEYEETAAHYNTFSSFLYFLWEYSDNASEMRLMGLPSSDGRGPSVSVTASVAIAASSSSIEGCKEFVVNMFAEDVQSQYASSSIPISRTAFLENARENMEQYNEDLRSSLRGLSEAEIRQYGLNSTMIEESDLENYVAIIDSCSSIDRIDPPVVSIVREEMQPYFEGQKSLDEVIEILQDRVRTYVNERG